MSHALTDPSGHRSSRTLLRVIGLARPATGRLLVAFLATLGALGTGISVPLLTKAAIDRGIGRGDRGLLVLLAAGVLAVSFGRAAFNFLRRSIAGKASVEIECDLRNRLFAHLQGLPVTFHDRWQTGQLLARATSDLNNIRMFLGFALVFLALVLAQLVAVLLMIARLDAGLALVTVVLTPLFLASALRFNYVLTFVARDAQERIGGLATVVEENAGGVRVVKAFGREGEEMRKLARAARLLMESNLTAARLRAWFVPLLQLIPGVNLALILWLGGYQVVRGSLTLGGLVAVNSYLAMLIWPLRHVGWILAQGQRAVASAERVFEVLDTQPDIRDRAGAVALDGLEGRIAFEEIWFRYPDPGHEPGEADWVLRDLSLEIAPGEVVALVGGTASGKSTLAALVPRFYDATRGRVLIDGRDVRDVALRSLRTRVGVVFDEPILFSASVRENIALGRPGASEEEIREAARAAAAEEFILHLPSGYDTRVGEQGFSLSGGQRQRVALARALLLDPQILILDDPLSSVDLHTEAAIERVLERLLEGRTTILVARRPSTVALAGRAVFLEGGRVDAVGTHAELMRGHPRYRAVLAGERADVDTLAARRAGGRP